MLAKKEIKCREEVEQLVNLFYDQVNADAMLGPVFNEQAKVNWPLHLPKMYDFWETLLFGRAVYKGMPFPKHATLQLNAHHFERWLQLFNQTLDGHFTGQIAEDAKSKAKHIANVFQMRLGLTPVSIGIALKK